MPTNFSSLHTVWKNTPSEGLVLIYRPSASEGVFFKRCVNYWNLSALFSEGSQRYIFMRIRFLNIFLNFNNPEDKPLCWYIWRPSASEGVFFKRCVNYWNLSALFSEGSQRYIFMRVRFLNIFFNFNNPEDKPLCFLYVHWT
jgi:hypothetical protein